MMTTTITIHNDTKDRIVSYGKMTETYNDVINRMFDENRLLNQTVDQLMEDIQSEHLLVGEFDDNEQNLIFQMLDGPLQSEDENVSQPAKSIEEKLKK